MAHADARLPSAPHLLAIAPPYSTNVPPSGSAALLGYLRARGVEDVDFLDLRLGVPDVYAPTYSHTGTYGDAFVMDVPDLPLVLRLLSGYEANTPLVPERDALFERYCLERGISPAYLQSYLIGLDRYFGAVFDQLRHVELVGFSVWTSNYWSTLLAAAHVKRRSPTTVIVAGGPQVTESRASAALGLRSGLFDVVARGEGEQTLFELHERFSTKGPDGVLGVPGTSWLDRSTGAVAELERPLARLPELPPPCFDRMALPAYQRDAYRTVPFQLSRGCTDKCSFCSEWVFWKHFRTDTPDHVLDQIEGLQARYDVDYISFSDSLLNGHPRRLEAFASGLLDRGIEVGWGGFMRAQVTPELARLLAKSGCDGVFIGVESFSDETLRMMNKRRTEADNIAAVRNFMQAGIHVTAGLIPGFPSDSRHGFHHTVTTIRKLQDEFPGQLGINTEPFILSPGQPMFSDLESHGLVPHAWDAEYLGVAPHLEDVTSKIRCRVDGASQGLERIGRYQIALSVSSDAPVASDVFDYQETESITQDEFLFEHLHRDWHLGTIKSESGHTYALLFTTDEMQEVQELVAYWIESGRTSKALPRRLRGLERQHLVSCSLAVPRLGVSSHRSHLEQDSLLAISPYTVARRLGSQSRGQVLLANYVTSSFTRRPASDARLLELLRARPRRLADLQKRIRSPRLTSGLTALIDEGFLIALQGAYRSRRRRTTGSTVSRMRPMGAQRPRHAHVQV